jgi:RNA polymerase sigma factor (sigma-70 family)
MMNEDMELLREYAVAHSEPAFEALVRRYIQLVHSSALRQVRDAHCAEDITQTVFIILARKAGSLGPKTILAGWLYRTTQYVCAAATKIRHRRERREQEAGMETMNHSSPGSADLVWEQLSPLLDEAMAQLKESDRDALLLRYFQNKSLREVGAALGVEESTAQKRVQRALEKLRVIFARHDAAATSAAIAEAISLGSIQTVPAVLIKSVAAAALAPGAAAGSSTSTILSGALKLMAWTKTKTAVVAGLIAVFAIGAGTPWILHHKPASEPVIPSAAGYGTPEATFQSMYWAATNGDLNMFLASLAPRVRAHFMDVQMKGKSEPEISQIIQRKAGKMDGVRLTGERMASDGHCILHLRFRTTKGADEALLLKKIDGEWKIDSL